MKSIQNFLRRIKDPKFITIWLVLSTIFFFISAIPIYILMPKSNSLEINMLIGALIVALIGIYGGLGDILSIIDERFFSITSKTAASERTTDISIDTGSGVYLFDTILNQHPNEKRVDEQQELQREMFLSRSNFKMIDEKYSDTELPPIKKFLEEFLPFISGTIEIINNSDVEKFKEIVKGIEWFYSRVNYHSESRSKIYAGAAYYLATSIGIVTVSEEKWSLLNQLVRVKVRIRSRNGFLPLFTHPIIRNRTHLSTIGRNIQEWVKNEKSWQIHTEDEIKVAYVHCNLLSHFYYSFTKRYKELPYPHFATYFAETISPLLEKIFIHEERDILIQLTGEQDEKTLIRAFGEYVLKIPRIGGIDNWSIQFELVDLNRDLLKNIRIAATVFSLNKKQLGDWSNYISNLIEIFSNYRYNSPDFNWNWKKFIKIAEDGINSCDIEQRHTIHDGLSTLIGVIDRVMSETSANELSVRRKELKEIKQRMYEI